MAEGGIAGGLNHAIKQIILVMAEGGIAGGLNHANKQIILVMAEGGIAGGLNHAIKQIKLVMAEGGIAGGLNHANKQTILVMAGRITPSARGVPRCPPRPPQRSVLNLQNPIHPHRPNPWPPGPSGNKHLDIRAIIVHVMFVFTAPHPASAHHSPAPPAGQAQPAHGAASNPIQSPSFRLLVVVHALMEFGRRLTHALGSQPAPHVLRAVTRTFGTPDLALIMARIMRALRMAEALRQRLVRTAKQIDNPRFRLSIPRPKTARPKPQPDAATEDLLAHLPTVEELAEQIRRRPIGAVLVDICRDLGIDMANPVWSPLYPAIAAHRGNLFRLLSESASRPRLAFPPEITAPAPATGPPTPA